MTKSLRSRCGDCFHYTPDPDNIAKVMDQISDWDDQPLDAGKCWKAGQAFVWSDGSNTALPINGHTCSGFTSRQVVENFRAKLEADGWKVISTRTNDGSVLAEVSGSRQRYRLLPVD